MAIALVRATEPCLVRRDVLLVIVDDPTADDGGVCIMMRSTAMEGGGRSLEGVQLPKCDVAVSSAVRSEHQQHDPKFKADRGLGGCRDGVSSKKKVLSRKCLVDAAGLIGRCDSAE